ncbi:MAG: pyrimidine-nucleoside phosphorylase [Lachnospira sp.]|nr:pyrimidine-nucleoside phosphorylase [Lachnospira sp.]
MRMYDLILKKRNAKELTKEEIDFIIDGYVKGEIPDYQVSALLMAIYFNGMTDEETLNLTMAMAHSGDMLDLSAINGIKVDKHSTGGVGDKTTLVLAPMVAALGVPVAKMSGRGLGHTGGTIDKLESFEGFTTAIDEETFIKNVNDIKIAIASQTGNLAPADKKLYALRDVTATVDNISLIAGSIMSKKLASGADGIVLDVKVGSGAFMKTFEDANKLATAMVNIGKGAGRAMVAVISNMDEPLGNAVGNNLEVIEAIETLKGRGPKDLLELCLCLGSHMVVLAKKAENVAKAREMLISTIEDGSALKKLEELVKSQNGDARAIYDYTYFKKAAYEKEIKSEAEGYVAKIVSEEVGNVAMILGGGRTCKESTIDLSVGVIIHKKVSDYVAKGDVIATLYANDEEKLDAAVKRFERVYAYSADKVEKNEMIMGEIH